MPDKRIIVLGAGLAGLSAAWHLQKSGVACSVYEKNSEVGGLCRSKTVEGFTFDYDGHLLHFRQPYAFDLIKSLLKDKLVEHERDAWVYFKGLLIPYPFQAHLRELPTNIAQECLAGFMEAKDTKPSKMDVSFLHWIKNNFGKGIAKHFMVPYNTKFWTVPPQSMACDWVDGFIPQPTLTQLLIGTSKNGNQKLGYNSIFWYPSKGGISQLASAFRNQLGNVHTNCEIEKIDLKKKELSFLTGPKIGFDHLISTIPLPVLANAIQELPLDIRNAFRKLRWNSILNINMGLKQKVRSGKHWIYFPHKEPSFFRAGFFHNFSSDLVPRGCASMYVDMAYSPRKPLDKRKTIERIRRDMGKIGLIDRGDKIIVTDCNDITYGYPIYDKNYSVARKHIMHFLSKNNITPCGRYGSWRYMSMEDVIMDGKEAAHKFI